MDVVRLNPDTHIPDLLIEGYESMIFTERYHGFGEFSLKTSRVVKTIQDLPFYSHISILNSREIMIVESHEIETDANGVTTLTVSGRSYINIFELRGLYLPVRGYHEPWPMLQSYPVTEALAVFIWNLICNNTGHDVIHGSGRPPINFMPNVGVSMIGDRDEPTQSWKVAEEDIAWTFVSNLLDIGALSLRTVRPIPEAESFQLVSVSPNGVISESTSTSKISRIEIYQGIDRSASVILRDDAGHFVTSKYLFSIENHRNIATVIHSAARSILFNPPGQESGAANATVGFARRVVVIDGGTAGEDPAAYNQLLIQKGTAALQEARPVTLFEGELALNIPYKYNVDYFLGDTILAVAEYGLYTKMQVTEYIRSWDRTGGKEYPTLMPTGVPVIIPEADACVYSYPPFATGTPPGTTESGSFTVLEIPDPGAGMMVYLTISESPEEVFVLLKDAADQTKTFEAVWDGSAWSAFVHDTFLLYGYVFDLYAVGAGEIEVATDYPPPYGPGSFPLEPDGYGLSSVQILADLDDPNARYVIEFTIEEGEEDVSFLLLSKEDDGMWLSQPEWNGSAWVIDPVDRWLPSSVPMDETLELYALWMNPEGHDGIGENDWSQDTFLTLASVRVIKISSDPGFDVYTLTSVKACPGSPGG